nr:tetratricopeptide repeat protein [Ardenticatena sp.]
MLSKLIQRQVPIGSKVIFWLKNGREISGELIELGRDHITLENENGVATILVEMIGAWEVVTSEMADRPDKTESGLPVTDTSSEAVTQADVTISASSIPAESLQPVLKKLIEIEARLEAQLQTARIELEEPDFFLPISRMSKRTHKKIEEAWNRVVNRYQYAKKINELSKKFGRIQSIVAELESLAEILPNSATVKRHLAYCYFLAGREKEAFNCYKMTATISREAADWYNLAVIALRSGQNPIAVYALEQWFLQRPITERPNAWYVYVNLLRCNGNYSLLRSLCENIGRDQTEQELVLLLETGIFLLKSIKKDAIATDITRRWLEEQVSQHLVLEAVKNLEGQPDEAYRQVVEEFQESKDSQKTQATERKAPQMPQGYIYTYKRDRNFGFLRDLGGNSYFFHRSAIIDPTLFDELNRLEIGGEIPVTFEPAQGPKGPLALRVALFRTNKDLFEIANQCAQNGDYSQAIGYIRQLLEREPEYPEARELYDKWREYARLSGVPRGSNPYARAKRVQLIEKDLDRAAQLFRQAIREGDNVESAIKDLAALYVQQGKPEEAIRLLEQQRKRIRDQQSVDNMLIGFYQNAGQYEQAIALLRKKLGQTPREKKTSVLWQIGNCYLRCENYTQARETFEQVLELHPDNLAARRNIAICHFKQQRYDDAERILKEILDASPDAKAAELLEAITQARTTGESTQLEEIIIETTLSEFSSEISDFTQFFLDRCDFPGVSPERIERDENGIARYRGSERDAKFDLKRLEEVATQLGTRRSRDRAEYYLSAAKIISIVEGQSSNLFYRYLCRSFASSGDATVAEGKPLDAARELYCEALSVYDRDRGKRKDEQDAVNALVRFLFSTLGQAQVPLTPSIPSIDETVERVLGSHPQRDRVFSAITYLTFRSRYAANRVLKRLFVGTTLQVMALDYLRSQGISVPDKIEGLDGFIELWNEVRRLKLDEWRAILSEFRFLARMELTTASLEDGIERLKSVNHRLFFGLDQDRARQLQNILETALELVKQASFEERERLCIQIGNGCNELLREIESSPTRLSVEGLYPVVKALQNKVSRYLEELYEISTPQLEIRLPKESYIPDSNQHIDVQIVVANKTGCSPAESLELIVQESEDGLFAVNASEIKLDRSLRGSDQHILEVPIRITQSALDAQTFSLPVYAQYRTRAGEIEQTPVHNFSIRLYSEEEFEEIENPYAAYAEGGIVGDPTMFYGRDELIENIIRAIQRAGTQSKSIVIFGQKRAGKSSILYHLKRKMEASGNLLVIDIGNIGSILDEHSQIPFEYQILWSILRKLRDAIEDVVEERGLPPLNLIFPQDREFYEHPSPLVKFRDVFDEYKRRTARTEGWKHIQVVLLIDEFSYIYSQIVSGKISESFMKNWKALLQENYFSVVLAGQDVMPKFKQRFPNEFGTTQDERVSYLKREDAIRLTDEPIRIGGRNGESRYRERAIERILELTAGSPFYIQIVCDRLVKYMNRKRASLITEADVEQVKTELVRGVNALGLDKFDNLINSGDTSEDAISDEDALKVLKAIAINSQTGPCNRNSISCETEKPIDVILEDLVNREVVERERGRYYRIRVGLFRDWLTIHQ